MVEHYGVVDHVCTHMFNLKMGNHERLLRLESLFNKCSIWPIALHKSQKNTMVMWIMFVRECINRTSILEFANMILLGLACSHIIFYMVGNLTHY